MMIELFSVILPILLVDALNPVLFAMLVFAAGSGRPVGNSSAILAGHTLAYLCAGIVIALGMEQLADRLANPQRIDFFISGLVGVGLLLIVLPTKKQGAPTATEPQWELTPAKCFGLGAIINFVGIPFALPYFAVVDQVLKADLSVTGSVTVLVIYNLLYAAPFLVVPAMVAVSGERAKPLLEKVNGFIGKASDMLMPWLFAALGVVLIADSVAFFYRGSGLLQF
jgi:cytochrome c biogenesis protein CcdA